MSDEKRVRVPVIINAKYGGQFYSAGDHIEILPKEIDALVNRGVILEEDVPEIEQSEVIEKPIDEMTIQELKGFAAKRDIELDGATKKDDILTIIKAKIEGGAGDGN